MRGLSPLERCYSKQTQKEADDRTAKDIIASGVVTIKPSMDQGLEYRVVILADQSGRAF